MKLLKQFTPSDKSLGKRAHMLMTSDLPQAFERELMRLQNQEDYNYQTDSANPTRLLDDLLLASEKYVEELGSIQYNAECHFWTPSEYYLYFKDD